MPGAEEDTVEAGDAPEDIAVDELEVGEDEGVSARMAPTSRAPV
jgi:hypothetical protein